MIYEVGKSYVCDTRPYMGPFTVVAAVGSTENPHWTVTFRSHDGLASGSVYPQNAGVELAAVFDLDVHLTQGPDGYQATAVPHGQAVPGSLAHTTVRLGAPAAKPRRKTRGAK